MLVPPSMPFPEVEASTAAGEAAAVGVLSNAMLGGQELFPKERMQKSVSFGERVKVAKNRLSRNLNFFHLWGVFLTCITKKNQRLQAAGDQGLKNWLSLLSE